jgi:hypothetical protein
MSAPARFNPRAVEQLEGIDEVDAHWESLLERVLVSQEISISFGFVRGQARGVLAVAALVACVFCVSNLITETVHKRLHAEGAQCVIDAKPLQAPQPCSWVAPTIPAAPNASTSDAAASALQNLIDAFLAWLDFFSPASAAPVLPPTPQSNEAED